jgi:hypothetical protein
MKANVLDLLRSFRPLLTLSLAVCAAWAPQASAQSYTIVPNITSVPAGSYGANIHALLPNDTSPTPDVLLCVYTGYGSTAPIAASTFSPIAGGIEAKFDVLPSTIQDVPPSDFTNGNFPAPMYTVPLGTTTCTGAAQATSGAAVTLNLEYPHISSLSLASALQQNPNLTRHLPQRVEVFGSNFVQTSSSTFNTPSHVVFTSTSTVDGDVNFIASSDLDSTFPAAIPSTATSVDITVCNTATYTYCSAPYALPLNPLQANSGSVTFSPSLATPNQYVKLSATFGSGVLNSAGVPGGQVIFTDNGTTVYSAPLTLDKEGAQFSDPRDASFTTTSTSLHPIVADFNRDGVPDVLFIEPNAVTHGSGSPVLHLLLGETPGGQPTNQFAPDLPYTGLKSYPCATLLGTALADFNLDGYPDLALLCSNPGSSSVIYTLLNKKNGTFSTTVSTFGPVFGTSLAVGDFNHDGKQDLVLAGPLNAAGDTGLQVLLGDGLGAFTLGPVSTGLDTASGGGFQIAASDLNADGFPDIAVLNGTSASGSVQSLVQIFENDGTGKFSPAATVPTDGTATATFLIAPLRPGQLPDLIITSSSSSASGVSVARNNSTSEIAFSSSPTFTSVPGLTQAVGGDFNGDGFFDLAVATSLNGSASSYVLTGDGQGIFSAECPQLVTKSPQIEVLLAAVDQNGDGYADLITATVNSGIATTLHSYITSGTASAFTPGFKFTSGAHRIVASTPGTVEISPDTAQTNLAITGTVPTITLSTSLQSPLAYGNILKLVSFVRGTAVSGSVSFYNGATLLGTAPLVPGGGFAVADLALPLPNVGTYSFTAVYAIDSAQVLTSAPLAFVITPIRPIINWNPTQPTIAYGTALSAAQLDATAEGISLPLTTGTYTYSPPLGTVLKIGTQPVSLNFTSTDPDYTDAAATIYITVTKATPVITWPTPSEVIVDTILSATQLNATAATPQGTALPGTFVYTPAAGFKLSVAGTQQLAAVFTPTDTVDYNTATASVSINVGPIGISSIAPAAALLGDPATTVTIVGTGFSPTSKVQIVGPAMPAVILATSYVSSTSLSAVVPASDLLTVQALQLSIIDPTKDLPSNAVPLIVSAPSTTVGVNAPSSISPASQNTVIFHLAPYPAPVTANFTLAFAPSGTLPDDPSIIFVDSGLRTASVTVPAHAAELDLPITFQGGTVSGALTLTLVLDAGGANVTPASIQPIVIPEPIAAPGISSVTLERNGDLLTVTTRGFSNTRTLAGAIFHFTPVPGGSISTKDLKIDVNSLFSTWYANPESNPYGSLFTYTEVFNLSSDASVVGQVTVTLTNDVGASQEANTP